MSLTKEQHDSIMYHYEQKQARRRRLLEQRRQEVYSAVPEYARLETEIPSAAVSALRRRLNSGDSSSAADLRRQIRDVAARKQQLLVSGGFAPDYLEVPYQCPDCRDTGYINGEKCHCFRQEEISILYDQSHLQLLTRTQNFDTLREDFYKGEDLKRFRAARNVSLHFARQFGREYSNLYFLGTVGTGKSFLSVCIAREVLSAGYSVLYFSAASLFDRLAGLVYNYRSREDFQHFVDDLYHCDLLIIDDLGTELTNQFVSAQLFACINERHLNRKPTVISTNLSLEDLQKRYSDRVFSRITSGYICCKLTGKDIRLLKKVRTMNGTHQET